MLIKFVDYKKIGLDSGEMLESPHHTRSFFNLNAYCNEEKREVVAKL
jgi:hypothetical protein